MPTLSGFTVTLADRVRETTQTTGTGTYSLDGAPTGKRTFVAGVGSGNRTAYVVESGASWEVGIGTVTSGAPSTLTRDAILASSNSNNAVSWAAGVKDIYVDIPAALVAQIYATPVASIKVTKFTSGGSFTRDAKCLEADVEVIGGGGGGAGGNSAAGEVAASGGGGGGGYSRKRITAATLGASPITVTVGDGGGGGASAGGGAAGSNGGTSSFGAHCSATGGTGGGVMSSGTTANRSSYAAGGIGSSGDQNGAGGDGFPGIRFSGTTGLSGAGGSSYLCGCTRGNTTASAGNNATAPGGGGSGALAINDVDGAGGDGFRGEVIVREYLSP